MLFDPFDASQSSNIKFTEFLDPDSNFFNSPISEMLSCDYFSIDQFNSLLLDVQKSQSKILSIFHLNICSLSKNYDSLIHFLSS